MMFVLAAFLMSKWVVVVVISGISYVSCAAALSHCQHFYTLPHDSARVLWFRDGRPCVCPSARPSVVRPSVFHFRMIT